MLAISFWESIWLIVVIFFWITWLMILFSIIIDLFRDRELGGGAKALWFLFILFFQFLGGFVYLLVRGKGMAERNMKEQADAKASFDEYVRQTAGGGAASELAKANELLQSGAISQADYDALKAKIIG